MLPCIFPPFPDRPEFDIYATMTPAKEVGGDFYDFFMVDDDHLAVVIADVSGKGIPAALFMMTAKTLIKTLMQTGLSPAQVFTEANARLCENNDEGMFVTAWMGVLEIPTGRFTYVNAGHNPPLLRRVGEDFQYLKSRAAFVFAGMEGIRYRQEEVLLSPGDVLYIYTDGVTEAADLQDRLYGNEQLLRVLNAQHTQDLTAILRAVKEDVDTFAAGVPQFDDITMLALRFDKKGGET
jgi:sigma-B regulation protein RsbU (phosphoserine phosphatase)